MAWEENSCICLNMQLIAILSRIGVKKNIQISVAKPASPIAYLRNLLMINDT